MLIIDDLNYKSLAIRYLKEKFPYAEIIEIRNQKQFYSAFDDVDAIITDYEIEWTNGIKILIEAKKRNPFMPVIMITEAGIEEVVIEAIEHGLDDYILKTKEYFAKLPAKVKKSIENERARKREKMLSSIVEGAKEAVVSVDAKGKIIYANKAVEEIFGWRIEELVGKHMSIMAIDAKEQKKQFEKVLQEGWTRFETFRRDKKGNAIPVSMTVIPFKDDKGNLLFSSAIMIDMREQKKYEEKIKHLNEILLAIRKINQFITKEKDEEKLLQKICEILYKVKGHKGVCILYDREIYGAGNKQECEKMMNFIEEEGKKKRKITIHSFNESYILECPITKNGINAFLYVFHSEEFNDEELKLLEEVSGDIAFALYSLKIEKTLKKEEELRKAVLSASPVGIGFTINRILGWANETMYRMVGYTPEETLGKSSRILYESDEEYEKVGKEIEKAFKEKRTAEIETKWRRKDGSTFDCLLNVHPINPEKPEEGAVAVVIDVTERKNLIKKLEESEEKYRTLAEKSMDGIFLAKGYKLIYANPALLKILGVKSFDEIKDINMLNLLQKKDAERIEKDVEKALKGEIEARRYEVKAKRLDSREIFIELAMARVMYEGKPHAIGIVRDITEKKKMESALRESEKRFRNLVENAHDAIYIITSEGFEYVNPAFEKLTGYKSDEILGAKFNFKKLIHPDDIKLIEQREKARREGKKIPERYEFRIIRKDGKIRTVEASTVGIGREGVKVIGMLRDVTERIKAEEKIKKLSDLHYFIGKSINRSKTVKELCRNLLKSIKEIIEVDYANIFIYDENKNILKPVVFYGYPEDFMKKVMIDYEVDENQPWEAVKSFLEKKDRYVKDLRKHKPLSFNWDIYEKYDVKELYTLPLTTKKKVYGVLQVINDSRNLLTEEKIALLKSIRDELSAGIARIIAEEEIRKAEEKYRNLVENAVEGIYRTTVDGKVLEINTAVAKIFGYTPEEFLKINVKKTFKNIERRKEFIEKLRKEGEVRNFEIEYIRKDGKTVIARESARLIKGGIIEGIIHDVTQEKEYERKLEVMAEISNMLIGKINIDEIYEKSLKGIIKTLGADGGVIFEKKKKYLYLRKSYGISNEYCSKHKKLLLGEHAVGISAKTRKPILIKDSKKDDRVTPDVVKSERYRSAMVVPIIFEKRVMGSIGIISRKPNYFSEKDVSTLQAIANQIAVAINSANLVEKVSKALEKEKEFKLKTAHYFFNPICIAKGFLELALEEEGDRKDKILKAINAINRVERVVKNVTQKGEIIE